MAVEDVPFALLDFWSIFREIIFYSFGNRNVYPMSLYLGNMLIWLLFLRGTHRRIFLELQGRF